jgi:hypothetical protein
VFLRGIKLPEREDHNTPPSSTEVKDVWNCEVDGMALGMGKMSRDAFQSGLPTDLCVISTHLDKKSLKI